MNVSLSGLWTNSYNFIRGKISEGLTQKEKTVAIAVIAYFALAAVAVLFWRCFCQDYSKTESGDSKESFKATDLNEKKAQEVLFSPVLEGDDILSSEKIKKKEDPQSVEKIGIENADLLRSLVDRYLNETLSTIVGTWRTLYLDQEGRLQGINGPDGDKIWLNGKGKEEASFYEIEMGMKKLNWDPKKRPAFTCVPSKRKDLPEKIVKIVETTVHELNQMAYGAHRIAEKKKLLDSPLGFAWLDILKNEKEYSSTALDAPDSLPDEAVEPLDDKGGNIAVDKPKAAADPAAVASGKVNRTIQERLEKNRNYAQKQQQDEKAKGFAIVPGEIPAALTRRNSPLLGKSVNLIGGTNVGIASCQGSRPSMEDADLVTDGSINTKPDAYPFKLFGVFDGHGGAWASSFVKENLSDYLIKELESRCKDGLTEEGIFHSLKECCKKLHADYQGFDGTTATIALIINDRLWVANVGDSRTILVNQDGTAIQASEDAKPAIKRYQAKIENLGGHVVLNRVNGFLAVARAIGDKNVLGVVPDPKITDYPLNFKYLVLACDGLYDVATTDEVGAAIKEMHDKGESPENMAKRLVQTAIQRGSSDNVSVIVIKR